VAQRWGRLLLAAAAAKLEAKRGGPGGRRWRRQRGHWPDSCGEVAVAISLRPWREVVATVARGSSNPGYRGRDRNVPAAVARTLSTLYPQYRRLLHVTVARESSRSGSAAADLPSLGLDPALWRSAEVSRATAVRRRQLVVVVVGVHARYLDGSMGPGPA